MALTSAQDSTCKLTMQAIEQYRQDGFARVQNIISREEAARFYDAALSAKKRLDNHNTDGMFTQFVNIWRKDEVLKQLTFHPNVGAIAEQLAGVPLRLWHDHVLIKEPHNQVATEFHQDQTQWPHRNAFQPVSCWIALCDVPVERGCMTFIPGSFHHSGLSQQNLLDDRGLFALCPELEWEPRVTIPLRAGDCTFHHGLCAHMATPNLTDEPRVAHVVVFTDATTEYSGTEHLVSDAANLQAGQMLSGELFPTVAEFETLRNSDL